MQTDMFRTPAKSPHAQQIPTLHTSGNYILLISPSLSISGSITGFTQNSPVQVECSDRPIQGGAEDNEAAGGEGDIGDAAGVLRECDEAQAAVGVPHFDLRE